MDSVQVLIRQACDDSEEVSFRNDYSGRGMYGRSCVGITGSHSQVMKVIAEVIKQATSDLFSTASDAESEEELQAAHQENSDVASLIDTILDYQSDSMGRDIIVYWSDLEPIEPVDISGMSFEQWLIAVANATKMTVSTLVATAPAIDQNLRELFDDECPIEDAKDMILQAYR